MSLEDSATDVIGKAIRGLGLDVGQLVATYGLLPGALEGEMDDVALKSVSVELGLDGDALVGLRIYLPELRVMDGVTKIELPFRSWTVNAWLLEKNGVRVLFDTGWGSNDLIEKIDCSDMQCVLITHGHVDHVGGIPALQDMGVRIVREDEALALGSLDFVGFRVQVFDLSGHCDPAVGYLVSGFEKDMLVVGDAIFAGSAGGCNSTDAFARAFETMSAGFSKLADDVLILPGHGPMTSLGEERRSNPFRLRFS